MPANYSRPLTQTTTPAQLRQGLGYIPPRQQTGTAGGGIDVDPGSGEISIADAGVSYAQLNLAGTPPTLVGRTTAGAGEGEPITVDPNNLILSAGVLSVTSVPKVSFGTGAPATTPLDGELYFDTTLPAYAGYVGRSGAWHTF